LIDLSDTLDYPKNAILFVLRVLWWFAWDFCVETIFWSLGWLTLRIVTFGRFPQEKITEVDSVYWPKALLVEAVGALVLGAAIWLLSGEWPSF
jgi:hypothetical protein